MKVSEMLSISIDRTLWVSWVTTVHAVMRHHYACFDGQITFVNLIVVFCNKIHDFDIVIVWVS